MEIKEELKEKEKVKKEEEQAAIELLESLAKPDK
jgi:hypothetical protein